MKRKLVVLVFLAACSATAYQHALDVSLASLNAARDSFTTWDKEHQTELVEAATTKEEAKASLAEYRKTRARVTAAFIAAYGAIAVASVKADAASITAAGEAVVTVYTELKKLFPGMKAVIP